MKYPPSNKYTEKCIKAQKESEMKTPKPLTEKEFRLGNKFWTYARKEKGKWICYFTPNEVKQFYKHIVADEKKKTLKRLEKLDKRITKLEQAKSQTALAIFDFFDKEKRDAMEYDSEFFAVRIKEYNNLKKKFLGKAEIAKLSPYDNKMSGKNQVKLEDKKND